MKKITASFAGKTLLVADDYVVNQELTKEMLEMMDCEVDIAEDGKEAFDMYNENSYDLIFMDVQMPEMDGYETTRKIRDIEGKDKHIPIVAITANALTGDKEKCIESGMDDYISKPIKGEILEEMLTRYLSS